MSEILPEAHNNETLTSQELTEQQPVIEPVSEAGEHAINEESDNTQQIAELQKAIVENAVETNEQAPPPQEGTAFTPPPSPSKNASFWKKAAVFGGMTLGLFGGKDATAQNKLASNTEGSKTEAIKSVENNQELTSQ
ncbi:MAG: hypothetical protein JWL92_425 [Candidatus Nomurabacteria bacterium]|nr:hypothetical protein [Candidatus Nomurabacteria bacterium]